MSFCTCSRSFVRSERVMMESFTRATISSITVSAASDNESTTAASKLNRSLRFIGMRFVTFYLFRMRNVPGRDVRFSRVNLSLDVGARFKFRPRLPPRAGGGDSGLVHAPGGALHA